MRKLAESLIILKGDQFSLKRIVYTSTPQRKIVAPPHCTTAIATPAQHPIVTRVNTHGTVARATTTTLRRHQRVRLPTHNHHVCVLLSLHSTSSRREPHCKRRHTEATNISLLFLCGPYNSPFHATYLYKIQVHNHLVIID